MTKIEELEIKAEAIRELLAEMVRAPLGFSVANYLEDMILQLKIARIQGSNGNDIPGYSRRARNHHRPNRAAGQ
jgi:hypothetical protein